MIQFIIGVNRFKGTVQWRARGLEPPSTLPKSQTNLAFLGCYGTVDGKYETHPRTRNTHYAHWPASNIKTFLKVCSQVLKDQKQEIGADLKYIHSVCGDVSRHLHTPV